MRASDSVESFLRTREGCRCHEGIKEGHVCFLFSFLSLKTCRRSSLDLLLTGARGVQVAAGLLGRQRQSPGAHLCSATPPPRPLWQRSTSSRPPAFPHSSSPGRLDTRRYLEGCVCVGGGCRAPSQNFQGLPVDELGRGRGKPHDLSGRRRKQGGDQYLESWRMFGEERNAAVGARAAS